MNKRIHGGTCKDIRLDLSVNINPLGMPAGGLDAAGRALSRAGLYPDTENDELVGKLSDKCGGNKVILGSGSCELIYALCHHIGHKCPGYGAFTAAPTFTEYGYAVTASGGRNHVFMTRVKDSFALSGRTEELTDAVRSAMSEESPVRLVFICNPNNPTGELMKREEIESMAYALEDIGVILAVDECFLRFSGRYGETTMTEVLKAHRNVLVLNAFTKFYAMPGLRLGYAVSANGKLLEGIRECMQPWNVSAPAVQAALCALGDYDFAERTVSLIGENRRCLVSGLEETGLKVVGRPEADFVFAEGPAGLKRELNKKGIDIRDCSDMIRHQDKDRCYYRIAVLGQEDNRELIGEIGKINSENV